MERENAELATLGRRDVADQTTSEPIDLEPVASVSIAVNQEDEEDEAEGRDPERVIRVRIGSWLLQLPEDTGEPVLDGQPGDDVDVEEFCRAVCRHLKSDVRVIQVEEPKLDALHTFTSPWWRRIESAEARDIVGEQDWFVGAVLSAPVVFSVHIPKKNQPVYSEGETPPAENYLAYWDGTTAMIGWEQEFESEFSNAGGQVVEDVLREAVESAGGGLTVQGCDPVCQHGFVHTELAITARPSSERKSYSAVRNSRIVKLFLPGPLSIGDMMPVVFDDFYRSAREFARMKNAGQRVLDLEESARVEFDSLLDLYQKRAIAATKRWRSRIASSWELRRWRREAEQKVARLWALLGDLEGLRRDWSERRGSFDSLLDQNSPQRAVYQMDQDDTKQIESLDLGLMEGGVQHTVERLDSHSVASLTALGALAGGIAGAVLGHVHW